MMHTKSLAAGVAVLAALMMLTASAASAPPSGLESYDAGATSSAFSLMLADEEIAGGLTIAGVTSDGPTAASDGAALLLGGEARPGPAPSQQPSGDATNEVCAFDEELPPPIDAAGLAIGCVATTAALQDGAPHSTSASESTTIPIGGSDLANQVLGGILEAGLGDGLDQILAGIDGPLLSAQDVVNELLAQLVDPDANAITITVAPNSSEALADDTDGVLARATADGATVELLPLVGGSNLLTVTVGSSFAEVVRDPVTGEVTSVTHDPAVVDLEWASAQTIDPICVLPDPTDEAICLADISDQAEAVLNDFIAQLSSQSPIACGLPEEERTELYQLLCLDGAAGFELDAAQSADYGFDFGATTVGARTTSVRLGLLAGANDGVPLVDLSLAAGVAAADAVPLKTTPTTDPPPTSTTEPEQSLPLTGGSSTPMLVLGLGAISTVAVIRARRRLA